MNKFSLSWVAAAADTNKLLRQFLVERQISRTALKDIKFHGGHITINGIAQNVRVPLQTGDIIEVVFPPENPSEKILAENIPLKILYEDDVVIVVNKPAGMNTIPSNLQQAGSLANALLYHYQQIELHATIHIVTRLDRDTSGIVLIAKHRHIHHLLSLAQQKNQVKRQYEAFVHGEISEQGSIIEPIGRKTDSIIEREVRPDGKYAHTAYERIAVHEMGEQQLLTGQVEPIDEATSDRHLTEFSHVRLQLFTGRTHQIRVHLSHIGHPLIGDDLYGGSTNHMKRQALHCCKISFVHPVSGQEIEITAALPEDMQRLL